MSETQPLPDGLVDLPPGPQLGAVLASIDRKTLSGRDCVTLLKVWYRQKSYVDAQFMACVAETALRNDPDTTDRDDELDEFSADETRVALALTRRHANDRTITAHDILTRLPHVWTAMTAGDLDEAKARIFSVWTLDLTDDQARTLVDALLPHARRWTTTQLIDHIKKLAIELDPEWAVRRYVRSIDDRRIVAYPNPDGTGTLTGQNLPADRVIAARAHLDDLARRAKNLGHPDTLDHLRADLYLGMTDGTFAGYSDDQILQTLLRDTNTGDTNTGDTDSDRNTDTSAPDDTAELVTPATPPGEPSATTGEPTEMSAADKPASTGAHQSREPAPINDKRVRRGYGVELRAALSTLAGLDRKPGDIPAWAPIHAELARDMAFAHGGGQWCFGVHDVDGRLLFAGITRHRPAGVQRHPSRATVELHLSWEQLCAWLRSKPPPGWETIIADIARQYVTSYSGDGDPRRRYPAAGLRRYLQMRDRHCTFPGCRVPARRSDIDHTVDYAKGGHTTADNLGPGCDHDHQLKDHGWTLTQPEPGVFHWRTRLGHTYQTTARITEPQPAPTDAEPDHPQRTEGVQEGSPPPGAEPEPPF